MNKMNKMQLFLGAATMVILGLILKQESSIFNGLALMWIGISLP